MVICFLILCFEVLVGFVLYNIVICFCVCILYFCIEFLFDGIKVCFIIVNNISKLCDIRVNVCWFMSEICEYSYNIICK